MRTQLELWKIVKDNFDEYFKNGLCLLIDDLEFYNILNSDECDLLNNELSKYGICTVYFLGVKGDTKPRLEFIEKMIKKHSKKD